MKKLFYILSALFLACGCKDDEKSVEKTDGIYVNGKISENIVSCQMSSGAYVYGDITGCYKFYSNEITTENGFSEKPLIEFGFHKTFPEENGSKEEIEYLTDIELYNITDGTNQYDTLKINLTNGAYLGDNEAISNFSLEKFDVENNSHIDLSLKFNLNKCKIEFLYNGDITLLTI